MPAVSPFGTQPSTPDVTQAAAMQGLQDRGVPGGAPTQDVQNPVAQHVLAIIDLMMSHAGDPAMMDQDRQAIQQLGDFIQQLVQGAQGGQAPMQAQAPPGQAMPQGPPMGPQGPPMGPQGPPLG